MKQQTLERFFALQKAAKLAAAELTESGCAPGERRWYHLKWKDGFFESASLAAIEKKLNGLKGADAPVKETGVAKNVTFEEFQQAVRFMLVKEHGTPELVADELIEMEALYLQRVFDERHKQKGFVSEAASEIALDSQRTGQKWVCLNENQMMLEVGAAVRIHLDSLVKTGLYGATCSEVAESMMKRGVEEVMTRGVTTLRHR